MINATQIRAARAILRLSQQELADRTDLSREAIKSAEKDDARSFASSLAAIEAYFLKEGLSFSHGAEGVVIRYDYKTNS